MSATISVNLDRPRAIRWTHRAEFALGSLERPPAYMDLAHRNPHRAFYALAAFVWAALVDREHPFSTAADVGQYLETVDSQKAAFAAVAEALVEAGIISKKKVPEIDSASKAGPSQSSSSAQAAPDTKTVHEPNGPPSAVSG